MTRIVRALFAGVALVVLAVGLPVALLRWGSWPITGLPTRDQVADLPSTVVSDSTIFGALTVAAWIVWAAFTLSVIVELATQLTGRRRIDLALLGPIQRSARMLVATIVMSVGATGSVTGAAHPGGPVPLRPIVVAEQVATVSAPAIARPVADERSADSWATARQSQSTVIRVEEGDTPWGLAEEHLGRGERWWDLWTHNQGRRQSDGRAWTDPELILPGWELVLPIGDASSASTDGPLYTVKVGDTLSEIALAQFGDMALVDDIVALNRGVLQADGRALTDPDLIRPGWVLRLPERVEDAPASNPPTPPAPSAPLPEPPSTTTSSRSETTVHPPTTVPHSPPQAQPGPSPDHVPDDDSEGNDAWPIGLAAGGLALVGLVALLDRRRRAQQRHRPHGRVVGPPPPPLRDVEARLRAGSDLAIAQLIDPALRAAAAGAAATGLPAINWVEAATHSVLLVLTAPANAPRGFRNERPDRWRSLALPGTLAQLGATATPPAPALCSVGTAFTGSELLIDLEQPAVTTVAGDAQKVTALLRSIAVGTATAPWSTHPHVLTIGLPKELAALTAVQPIATLAEALDLAESHARRVTRSLASVGCQTVPQARAVGATPDAWDPLIVVSADPPHELEIRRLRAFAQRPGAAVAVVCPGRRDSAVGRRCVIDEDAIIRIDGVDVLVHAGGLQEPEAEAFIDLVEEARSRTTQPAEHFAEPDLRTPPRDATPDGRLEDLLADVEVVIRVLGKVQTVRRRDPSTTNWPDAWAQTLVFERQKALEAISYLALRETAVDREDLEAALWPRGTNAQRTYHNAITDARRVLGEHLLPHPEGGLYQLSDRVVTDYGLFCELVARANESDETARVERLTDALTLVDGEPFMGTGRGFAWVGAHRGMIVAQVIDAAEDLAEILLVQDDWRQAEWAARQGLRAFPADERMYRLLMRAAHAAGNIPGVRRAYQELLDVLADPDQGVEPEDTVHPETIELLERLTGRSTA